MVSAGFLSWLTLSILTGAVFILMLALRYAPLSRRKKLEDLRNQLGGDVVVRSFVGSYLRRDGLLTRIRVIPFETYLKLNKLGTELRVILEPATKNDPKRLTLMNMRTLPFRVSISRENIATRGLSKLGLMQDIRIGVSTFDETYVIRSSDPLQAQVFFQEEKNRNRIDRLFDAGFDHFRVDQHASSASKPDYTEQDLHPAWITEYFASLNELIR